MDFLHERRIADIRESQGDVGSAFMDLTYLYSNKIFHFLSHEGLINDKDSSQTLSSFLEVVSFVNCWIEMEVKRRVPRQRLEDLNLVFSSIKTSWGLFFADPPEGPRLQSESVESICVIMTRRCDQYHSLYLSDLQTYGWLRAFRACCAALLENVLPGYRIKRGGLDKDQEMADDLDEPVIGYIGEMLYDLDRDVHIILVQDKP